jgi:hypothetical protein
MHPCFRLLACGALLLCTSRELVAQIGGEITGDSPRMAGLAGAGLAGGEDLAEAARNPAMLGFALPILEKPDPLEPFEWEVV